MRGLALLITSLLLLLGCSRSHDANRDQQGANLPHGEVEHRSDEGETVRLSKRQLEVGGVQTAPATRGTISLHLSMPGRVEIDPARVYHVHAPQSSRVTGLRVTIGSEVAPAETLVVLEPTETLSGRLALRAPAGGVITELSTALGEFVTPERDLLRVSDLAGLWVVGRINEAAACRIRKGAAALVLAPSAGAKRGVAGTVSWISPQVDPLTRTVDLRITPENLDGLKIGMAAQVLVQTESLPDRIVVPESALQTVADQTGVFIEEQPGEFRFTTVRVGAISGEKASIDSGLEEGESVVVAGAFLLKSELKKSELAEDH